MESWATPDWLVVFAPSGSLTAECVIRSRSIPLQIALGKALETRNVEEIKTPDGELAYDAIQRVRHVLLSEDVRLARTPA